MEIDLPEMLFGAAAIAVVPNALVAAFDILRRHWAPLRLR